MRIRVETIRSARSYTIEQAVLAKGIHLLPFRTEKLSPSAPMLLRQSTWESRSPPLFKTKKLNTERCWAFFMCPASAPLWQQGTQEVILSFARPRLLKGSEQQFAFASPQYLRGWLCVTFLD